MKIIKTDLANYFISEECYAEEEINRISEQDSARCTHNAIINKIKDQDQKYYEYLQEHSQRTGLKKMGILEAHCSGSSTQDKTRWNFTDNKNSNSVQDWIQRHDGKYHTLAIYVCRPNVSEQLRSKTSLLLFSDTLLTQYRIPEINIKNVIFGSF